MLQKEKKLNNSPTAMPRVILLSDFTGHQISLNATLTSGSG